MKLLKRFVFNLLTANIPSCILRSWIFKLFGAEIGRSVRIEHVFVVNYDGKNLDNLALGDEVYVGAGSILDLKEKIVVGKSTKIAAGCNFSTHADCGENNPAYELYPRKKEPIKIGEGAWIGLSVTILCGVTIGDNTIIGAGSLVNKDIPSGVMAYGAPVKVCSELNLRDDG